MADIETVTELFRATDERFTYWHAVNEGINASFDIRAYSRMDTEQAMEIAFELMAIARFCGKLERDFGEFESG